MKNYIERTFERVELSHLTNFLIHGAESFNESNKPYSKMLEDSRKELYIILEQKFSTFEEFNEIEKELTRAFSICEEVNLEMGMKLGAKLIHQLLIEENR